MFCQENYDFHCFSIIHRYTNIIRSDFTQETYLLLLSNELKHQIILVTQKAN